MTILPSHKPIEVIRKLRKAGFVFDRHAKGSHEIWYNPTTYRRTVVPNHPGKDTPKGTLRAIIKEAGLKTSIPMSGRNGYVNELSDVSPEFVPRIPVPRIYSQRRTTRSSSP